MPKFSTDKNAVMPKIMEGREVYGMQYQALNYAQNLKSKIKK